MLTPDQVDFYGEYGYVMVPEALTAKEVAELRAEVDRIVAGAASATSTVRTPAASGVVCTSKRASAKAEAAPAIPALTA